MGCIQSAGEWFLGRAGSNPVLTRRRQLVSFRIAITSLCQHSTSIRMHHDDVIKWKHFRVTGHFVREIHRSLANTLTKASDAELWCFLRSVPWINGWVNNREAADLRRHRAHYDVIVMFIYRYLIIRIMYGIWNIYIQQKRGGGFSKTNIMCIKRWDFPLIYGIFHIYSQGCILNYRSYFRWRPDGNYAELNQP